MSYKKLEVLINNDTPFKATGSGFTAGEFNTMVKLLLVKKVKIPTKTGKLPAKPNGFEFTDLGKSLVQKAISGKIDSNVILNNTRKQLMATVDEIRNIKAAVKTLEQTLQVVSNKLDNFSIETDSGTQDSNKLSGSDFLRLIKQAQQAASNRDKIGNQLKTGYLFAYIQRHRSLSQDRISDYLFTLYQKNIIDLQMGPSTSGEPGVNSPSGKTFHLVLIKR